MSWVKHDDGFSSLRKVRQLTVKAYRLHFCALEFCAKNLTDGTVDNDELPIISEIARVSRPKRYVEELRTARLWNVVNRGYEINDYLDYNPSAEEVKLERKRNADRQRRFRNAKRNADSNGVTNGVSNGAPSPSLEEREVLIPALASFEGSGEEEVLRRLVAACGGGPEVTRKLERTIRANRSAPGDVRWALERATGPGVREPIAVALKELKKRGDERKQAA